MNYTVRWKTPFFVMVSRKDDPEDAYERARQWNAYHDEALPHDVTIETPSGRILRSANFTDVFQDDAKLTIA